MADITGPRGYIAATTDLVSSIAAITGLPRIIYRWDWLLRDSSLVIVCRALSAYLHVVLDGNGKLCLLAKCWNDY